MRISGSSTYYIHEAVSRHAGKVWRVVAKQHTYRDFELLSDRALSSMSQICLKIGRSIARSPQSSAMRLCCKICRLIQFCISRSVPPLFMLRMRSGNQLLGSFSSAPFRTEHAQWVTVTKCKRLSAAVVRDVYYSRL